MDLRGWNLLHLPASILLVALVVAIGQFSTACAEVVIPAELLDEEDGEESSGEQLLENVFLPADRTILQRLTKALALIERSRFGEAVRYLGGILETPEDYFFQPDKRVPIHRSLKIEAQRLIGQMPRDGRELYELQYGARAQRLLSEAVAAGDESRLAEVARRFFHTHAGREATYLLGIERLDRGYPLYGALTLKRLRNEGRNVDALEPALSLALATCWLQADMPLEAQAVLEELKASRGNRPVRIGGKELVLAADPSEALSQLADSLGTPGDKRATETEDWKIFRGGVTRNRAVAGSAPLLNVRWRIPATDKPMLQERLRQLQDADWQQGVPSLPGLHPLVVDDVVLMRTVRNLLAVDFRTGKRLWDVPVDDLWETTDDDRDSDDPFSPQASELGSQLTSRMWDDAAFGTLSSDGRYVFAIEDLLRPTRTLRSPRRIINGRNRGDQGRPNNRLVAYDIHSGKLKWHLGGPADQFALRQSQTFFLGPPLPLLGQLYVLAEEEEILRLLVLDAHNGDLLWSQQLAEVEQDITANWMRRMAGASPSYADGVLVCPTSAGAVVAVELATRSLLWGYRYERSNVSDRFSIPGFAGGMYPGWNATQRWADAVAMVVDGRVLVTPRESDALHCLDLETGQLLWKCKSENDLYVACVHQGKVILAGRKQLRAVELEKTTEKTETVDVVTRTGNRLKTVRRKVTTTVPEPAWNGRTIALPEGAMPSGRGFLSGDRYFVPLTSSEVMAVDLIEGKAVHVSKSRKGLIPGNLVCYKGMILSQSIEGLDAFYQLEAVRREVDRRLAVEPEDAEALALKGEILLDQHHLDEAISCLRRAYEADAAPRTRDLLRDALLDGLRRQFASHRNRTEEIEKLLDGPQQRATYLRLMATGLQQAGEWSAALDRYTELMDFDPKGSSLDPVEETRLVRRDRWIQARLTELRQLSGDSALVDRLARQRLDAALASSSVEPLRKFLAYFGSHPTAERARDELFGRLKDAGLMLEAEMLLWPRVRSTEASVAAGALAQLAEMLRQYRAWDEAAVCYAQLNGDYADVVCFDEKTGRELVESLPAADPVRELLRADATWPVGKVEVKSKSQQLTNSPMRGQYVLRYRGDTGPFFSQRPVRLDQTRRALIGYDALGKSRWKASLLNSGVRQVLPFNPTSSHGRVCGHLMVVSMGSRIACVNTLGTSGRSEPKLLWTQNLSNVKYAARMQRIAFQGLQPFGRHFSFGGPFYDNTEALGPVTSRQVCYQQYNKVMAVDPLTGETLWTREGVAAGSTLFGDDDYLFAVAPNSKEAFVFRASDGYLLGRRKVPRASHTQILRDGSSHEGLAPFAQSVLTTRGRQLLLWRAEQGQATLEMFDPWEQAVAWPARTFAADAQTALISNRAVGVFQRDGHFVLLDLADGHTIVEAQLEAEPNLVEILLLHLADQYILITNSQGEQADAPPSLPQPILGASSRPIHRGRIYAFDSLGNSMWPEPAKIKNQHLLQYQPGRLPVLTFACQIYDRSKQGSARYRVSVVCVDRRNGRKVYAANFPEMTNTFEISGDPKEDTVRIDLNRKGVTLKFTDQPLPPRSEEPEEPQSKLPSSVRSLLKAIGKALSDPSKKPVEPKEEKNDSTEE